MKKKDKRYWLPVLILVLLAAALGGLALGTAWQVKSLEWFSGLLDVRPWDLLYVGCLAGALGLAALMVYYRGLNPYAARRRLGLVFLNLWAPFLLLGLGLAANDRGINEEFTWLTRAAAPGVALAPPLLLLLLEAAACRIVRGLGRNAQERGWIQPAMRFYMMTLQFRPEDRETRKRCGLLYVQDDECGRGLPLLEALGEIEAVTDEETLKAMEHCYRTLGNVRDALRVLLRMHQLRPDQPWIERKILDDYVRLELNREALDLIESGRLKMNLELLQLAERLNLSLGNYAQAMALIRQIANEEGRPHNLAIRLYRDMLRALPDHTEVRIALGTILLEDENEERRREGAALIDEVLGREGHRLHLARRLIQFYGESNQLKAAHKYLKLLVQAGDPDPEYHLAYAQALIDDAQHEEAIRVLQGIVKRWPEDWRGSLRLSRAWLQIDRLDEAEQALNRTAELAPAEAGTMIEPIRTALKQRQRQNYVKTMSEDVDRHGYDVEKRLELIEHQIEMEWIDEALAECDRLVEETPELLEVITGAIERGIQRVPRSFSLRDYLSDIYFQQGRYDDTLRLYREMAGQSLHPTQVITDGCRRILVRAPGHLEARRELALARRREEDWAGVLEALDRPIHDGTPLPPEDKVLWVEAAYRLWRLDGAVRIGLTLVEDMIEEPGYLMMMIDVLMDAQEFDKALELYHKARAAHPGNVKLGRMETKVVTARTRHRMAQLQRAVLSEGDLSPQEHYEKAELHRALGQVEEAFVHYQRAAYDPGLMALATSRLAETLCERGMYDLADETLDPVVLNLEQATAHPELKEMMYRVGRQLERMRYFERAVKYYKRIFRVDASYEDVVDRIDRLT